MIESAIVVVLLLICGVRMWRGLRAHPELPRRQVIVLWLLFAGFLLMAVVLVLAYTGHLPLDE